MRTGSVERLALSSTNSRAGDLLTSRAAAYTQGAVLLLEPDRTRLTEMSAVFAAAAAQVNLICGLRELFHASSQATPDHVLLSDTLGNFALRAAAETSRRQWPKARIHIFGVASSILEDNLYDTAVRHPSTGDELLRVIMALEREPLRAVVSGLPHGNGKEPSDPGSARPTPAR